MCHTRTRRTHGREGTVPSSSPWRAVPRPSLRSGHPARLATHATKQRAGGHPLTGAGIHQPAESSEVSSTITRESLQLIQTQEESSRSIRACTRRAALAGGCKGGNQQCRHELAAHVRDNPPRKQWCTPRNGPAYRQVRSGGDRETPGQPERRSPGRAPNEATPRFGRIQGGRSRKDTHGRRRREKGPSTVRSLDSFIQRSTRSSYPSRGTGADAQQRIPPHRLAITGKARPWPRASYSCMPHRLCGRRAGQDPHHGVCWTFCRKRFGGKRFL